MQASCAKAVTSLSKSREEKNKEGLRRSLALILKPTKTSCVEGLRKSLVPILKPTKT